nr:amidohydrolase family protein [Planctomycetota bacterium]
ELKAAKITVALQPLGLGASTQARESMLALAKAGVPFAFGLADTGGSAAVLRESAALAVRAGLDRATAWRAITSTAAGIIGAGDRVGRIAAGFDADLVLWSGDPLSITSRPVAVYLNGELTEGATH